MLFEPLPHWLLLCCVSGNHVGDLVPPRFVYLCRKFLCHISFHEVSVVVTDGWEVRLLCRVKKPGAARCQTSHTSQTPLFKRSARDVTEVALEQMLCIGNGEFVCLASDAITPSCDVFFFWQAQSIFCDLSLHSETIYWRALIAVGKINDVQTVNASFLRANFA